MSWWFEIQGNGRLTDVDWHGDEPVVDNQPEFLILRFAIQFTPVVAELQSPGLQMKSEIHWFDIAVVGLDNDLRRTKNNIFNHVVLVDFKAHRWLRLCFTFIIRVEAYIQVVNTLIDDMLSSWRWISECTQSGVLFSQSKDLIVGINRSEFSSCF